MSCLEFHSNKMVVMDMVNRNKKEDESFLALLCRNAAGKNVSSAMTEARTMEWFKRSLTQRPGPDGDPAYKGTRLVVSIFILFKFVFEFRVCEKMFFNSKLDPKHWLYGMLIMMLVLQFET